MAFVSTCGQNGSVPPPVLSVVIPCLNERENLAPLLSRLLPVLEAIGQSWEVVFVDDGSTDSTADDILAAHGRDARVKLLSLSRNFGHQAALSAGLEAASGDAVVLMDADLQDPPELIPKLVEEWKKGAEVVYAVRASRDETFLKRGAYTIFYRTLTGIANVDVPPDAGDFSLLDRAVADAIRAMPERNRFLRGLRAWVGFRQVGVPFDRPARLAGAPKYGLRSLAGLALSGYVGFSTVPLRLAAWLGFVAAGLGFALTGWVVWTKLAGIPSPRGWASTAALVLFMGGVQLMVLGVFGEYLGRVYDEVRERPSYVVRRRTGFEASATARNARGG